jgi:hypothetical protein
MSIINRRLHWVFVRSWPLWAGILLFVGHVPIGLLVFDWDPGRANLTVALLTQISGVILAILSIDSTITHLKKTSVFEEISRQMLEYRKAWPRSRERIEGRMHVQVSGPLDAVAITGNVGLGRESQEERIAWLEEQYLSLKREFDSKSSDFQRQLTDLQMSHGDQMNKIKHSLGEVEIKIEGATIGGLKTQFFGLFLFVYGAITAYFAGLLG